MSENLYLLSICLLLGAIVLVFGMRSLSAVLQARARLANDDDYRQLAIRAAAAQAETAAALAIANTVLADMQSRLAQVEKLLREVE
ncbi:MAG: hypothetical protein V4508_22295 [Pseudomonadota bacterium]